MNLSKLCRISWYCENLVGNHTKNTSILLGEGGPCKRGSTLCAEGLDCHPELQQCLQRPRPNLNTILRNQQQPREAVFSLDVPVPGANAQNMAVRMARKSHILTSTSIVKSVILYIPFQKFLSSIVSMVGIGSEVKCPMHILRYFTRGGSSDLKRRCLKYENLIFSGEGEYCGPSLFQSVECFPGLQCVASKCAPPTSTSPMRARARSRSQTGKVLTEYSNWYSIIICPLQY